nr:hypothetical protein [uncultured Pedobacter sp.]
MQQLTSFLTKIQTFELKVVERATEDQKDSSKYYSLQHETKYYDSFSYDSELRVLKDMAKIEMLSLDKTKIASLNIELKKLVERFNEFWRNFHTYHSEWNMNYEPNYLFSIRLDKLFIVKNMQASGSITVESDFVECVGDSVKMRETYLKSLIYEMEEMLHPKETYEEWKSKNIEVQSEEKNQQTKTPTFPETPSPTFTQGTAEEFLKIISPYFQEVQQTALQSLIKENKSPDQPLIFQGNGNQLADAFKQLYEANLIVGCNKSELEKWIAPNFLYTYNKNTVKNFTEGWLNGIISSDSKPCKSPILEVRSKEGVHFISSTLRNKRNNKY